MLIARNIKEKHKTHLPQGTCNTREKPKKEKRTKNLKTTK
jgi:hypothetical protein